MSLSKQAARIEYRKALPSEISCEFCRYYQKPIERWKHKRGRCVCGMAVGRKMTCKMASRSPEKPDTAGNTEGEAWTRGKLES